MEHTCKAVADPVVVLSGTEQCQQNVDRLGVTGTLPVEDDLVHDCAICLDCKKRANFKRLPCGHLFHGPCIQTWFHKSNLCPLCRTPATGPTSLYVLPYKNTDLFTSVLVSDTALGHIPTSTTSLRKFIDKMEGFYNITGFRFATWPLAISRSRVCIEANNIEWIEHGHRQRILALHLKARFMND